MNEIELTYYDQNGNPIDKTKNNGKTDSDVWSTLASSLGAFFGSWSSSKNQSTAPAQVPTVQLGNNSNNSNTMIIAMFGLIVVMMFLFFMTPTKKR